jgi:hypothetical protein
MINPYSSPTETTPAAKTPPMRSFACSMMIPVALLSGLGLLVGTIPAIYFTVQDASQGAMSKTDVYAVGFVVITLWLAAGFAFQAARRYLAADREEGKRQFGYSGLLVVGGVSVLVIWLSLWN